MDTWTLVVLSDLHISAGPLDDYDHEIERHFVSFVESLCGRKHAVELVINGDFLDFVQAPPWAGSTLEGAADDGTPLCYTEEQSLEKLESILAAHPATFAVLASFLSAHQRNRLVILPGNHDADFFWPEVRNAFVNHLGLEPIASRKVYFHIEQVYRPPLAGHVWIEHGHQYDQVNCFAIGASPFWSAARPPILRDTAGVARLLECVGTRFLIKYLNDIDRAYPFVDNVKPFSRFLRLFVDSAATWEGGIKAAVALWSMGRFIFDRVTSRPSDILAVDHSTGCETPPILSWFESLSAERRAEFVVMLGASGFRLNMPFEMYCADQIRRDALMGHLAQHFELLPNAVGETMLGAGPIGTLALERGFLEDETTVLREAATSIIRRGEAVNIIMGHTHEHVGFGDRNAAYINAGSWTRYLRWTNDTVMPTWRILRHDSYTLFPYDLKYVEVQAGTPTGLLGVTYAKRVLDE